MVLTISNAAMRLTAANDNSSPATGVMVAYYLAIRVAYTSGLQL
jgi:hypothetical protein